MCYALLPNLKLAVISYVVLLIAISVIKAQLRLLILCFSLKYILFKYNNFVVTYTFPYMGFISRRCLNLKVFGNKGTKKIFESKMTEKARNVGCC